MWLGHSVLQTHFLVARVLLYLIVLRAGCGILLYIFLILAYLSPLDVFEIEDLTRVFISY